MKHIRGFGTLYQRAGSRNWYIEFYHQGRVIRRSAGTEEERKAGKFLIAEVAKARSAGGAYAMEQERLTFDALIEDVGDDYKINGKRSLRSLRVRMIHLRPIFGGMRALKITTAMMVRYQRNRLGEDATPASVNREIALLKRAFNLAAKNGVISKANVPAFPQQLEENNVREGFVDRAGFEAVRDAMPDYLHDPLTFAFRTGWRIGAVRGLRWSSVDYDNQMITLERSNSKNKRPWLLPLDDPELFAVIERAWQRRRLDCLHVFHHEGRPLAESTFRKYWPKATAEAGLSGLLIHDLRRSAARNLVRAGVHENVAMAITGHKTRAIFDRYNIIAEDDLREAIRRQSEYLAAQTNRPKVMPIRQACDQTVIEPCAFRRTPTPASRRKAPANEVVSCAPMRGDADGFGLKILRGQPHAGSSPALGTKSSPLTSMAFRCVRGAPPIWPSSLRPLSRGNGRCWVR
jgi:integrase